VSIPEPAVAEERRPAAYILGLACLAILVVACYGTALFGGGQFGFRDAAHFYYPLYKRVQQEWAAGRLPLWEPGENGGTPLLGNPTAAVLYPGKLLFAPVPFAWGMRLYVIAHEVLAFGAMLALARTWGTSLTGATLAASCYAFGGPALSNHFNVIYLVGAAWAPLAIRAADGWLRLRRRSAPAELAVVLAMQILGGDPQAAYVCIVCALGYAIGLARPATTSPGRPWRWVMGILAAMTGWAWIGPHLASWVHGRGGQSGQAFLALAWGLGILLYVATRRRGQRARLGPMLLGLAGSCGLAMALAGAQAFPVVEHVIASARWAGAGPSDLYDSSLLPYRVVEWIWPNVFGTFSAGNRYWMPLLPPAGAHRPWPLSLCVGTLPLVLAFSTAGFRGGPPWRAWMTAIVLVTFWASLGDFAGPSRWSGGEVLPTSGDGTFYGLLTTLMPGLRLFRLPYKLLTFTSLALAILAGMGWDRLAADTTSRRAVAITVVLLVPSAIMLATVGGLREQLVAAMARRSQPGNSVLGPLDAPGAVRDLLGAMGHGLVALLATWLIVAHHPRRRDWAGLVILSFVAIDLAWANARLVMTVPQADFERVPACVQSIRAAEQANPTGGPVRVHRLEPWVPAGWSAAGSAQRLRDLVDWEIDTVQPRFGLLHGISYLLYDESRTGRADYDRFFEPAFRTVDGQAAMALGVEPGQRVLWYPRGAFDLWGARFFILPSYPAGWTERNRSYAAFVERTDLIYPDPGSMEGPAHRAERQQWLETTDVQVRRNRTAFPRAWVVHGAHLIRPLGEPGGTAWTTLMARIHRESEPTPDDRPSAAPRLRAVAYIETDRPERLGPYLPGTPPDDAEVVTVRDEAPTRTVLEARLSEAGLIILADPFDAGWQLTIDGIPSPTLRANLLMRAAAVPAGAHILVYTYEPRTLRAGFMASAAGLVTLAILVLRARIRPVGEPAPSEEEPSWTTRAASAR
jgi:hypothetical protein